MSNSKADKQAALSRRMQFLCLAACAVFAGSIVYLGYSWAIAPENALSAYSGADIRVATLASWQKGSAWLLSAINLGILCFAFFHLARFFRSFRRGEFLSLEQAKHIRTAGSLFMASALWSIIAHTLSVAVLTISNPAGERQLSIAFSTQQLYPLIIAGVLFAIGHMLTVARDLDDENKGFV